MQAIDGLVDSALAFGPHDVARHAPWSGIEVVANDGVLNVGAMDADLMRATRLQFGFEHREVRAETLSRNG